MFSCNAAIKQRFFGALLYFYLYFFFMFGIDLSSTTGNGLNSNEHHKQSRDINNDSMFLVNISIKQRNDMTRSIVRKLINVISYIPLMLFFINRCTNVYKTFPHDASCVDIISAIHHFLSMCILFMAKVNLCSRQRALRRLLPRISWKMSPSVEHLVPHLKIFLFMLGLNSPYFITDCKYLINDLTNKASLLVVFGSACAIYTWLLQIAAATIYVQTAKHICDKLRTIDAIIAAGGLWRKQQDHVIVLKAQVRHDIAALNGRFGMFVMLLYLKIFTLVTYNINKIVTLGDRHWLSASLYVTGSCLQVFVTFTACQMGSELIDLASRTHRRLFDDVLCFDYGSTGGWSRANIVELREILAFREEWDSLRISDCFVNRKSTMFTYVGTLVSSIAIILQFDYRILHVLDRSRVFK